MGHSIDDILRGLTEEELINLYKELTETKRTGIYGELFLELLRRMRNATTPISSSNAERRVYEEMANRWIAGRHENKQ